MRILFFAIALLLAAAVAKAQMPTTLAGAGKPASGGGGAVTFDPANAFNIAFSNGNLTVANTSGSAAFGNTRSTTSHTTGKFYFEWHVDNFDGVSSLGAGVVNGSFTFSAHFIGSDNNGNAYYNSNNIFLNGVNLASGPGTYTTGDVISFAVDVGAGLIWYRKNAGVWSPSGDPASGTGGYNIGIVSNPLFIAAEVETSNEILTGRFTSASWSGTNPVGFGQW